ncbi:Hypothetical predicted protein [Mytilus galloprovincialis]|uniref:Uncharacterized protein n=1 Tax=Mytilus galloprovincialis TaxID=29158 RepID=A0A8B6G3N1_MYTGA|nr:Hypothetical predicted protein [Mytilus galloprovincialis]
MANYFRLHCMSRRSDFFRCSKTPCQGHQCEGAVCRSNFCGGCNRIWYNNKSGFDVTRKCVLHIVEDARRCGLWTENKANKCGGCNQLWYTPDGNDVTKRCAHHFVMNVKLCGMWTGN